MKHLGFGKNPARGYWDHALIDELGGENIVVVPARHQGEYIRDINATIAEMEKCSVVLTGDEESVFPWRKLKHPNMRVFIMHPRVGIHDEAFKFPNGYRQETREILKDLQMDRVYDWSFSGQVTHDRRIECTNVLRALPNGHLNETVAFGSGHEYPEYLKIMAQSKVIPCPSGPETPDSFRLYEALEAGCIPVVDSHSTNNPTLGFWTYLFGEVPFPVIDKWEYFPGVLDELLKDWQLNANVVFSWWLLKKRELWKTLRF